MNASAPGRSTGAIGWIGAAALGLKGSCSAGEDIGVGGNGAAAGSGGNGAAAGLGGGDCVKEAAANVDVSANRFVGVWNGGVVALAKGFAD